MTTFKKLKFPSTELKNHLLDQLKANKYKILDSSPSSNFLSICDDFTGQAIYSEIFDKNSSIDYRRLVDFSTANFPSYDYPFLNFTLDKCASLVRRLTATFNHEAIASFNSGIFHCNTKYLEDLLKIAFEEVFFDRFPEGKIISVRLDYLYYKRSGMNRALYSFEHYPDMKSNASNFDGFNTLRNWLMAESHEIFSNIIQLAEYFFFPFVTAFLSSYRIGWYLIFIPTEPIEFKLGSYPRDIMDFVRTGSDFAKQSIQISTWTNENLFAKYCFDLSPSFDQSVEFILWAVNKSNEYIKYCLNITNYPDENDPNTIDPVYSLEYNLSLLHLIKIGLSILSSNSIYFNKSMTFQSADILGELSNKGQLGVASSADYFKMLFDRDSIIPKIESILNSSSLSFKNRLISTVNLLYEKLNQAMKDSVWVNYKLSGNNVIVKDAALTSDTTESISKFTSNVIRSLRNTHHSYFTRKDKYNRPSRYLSLIDGNIPDSFSSLTLFWLLCLLEDRNSFVGSP
jgi:hypothetical protein